MPKSLQDAMAAGADDDEVDQPTEDDFNPDDTDADTDDDFDAVDMSDSDWDDEENSRAQ